MKRSLLLASLVLLVQCAAREAPAPNSAAAGRTMREESAPSKAATADATTTERFAQPPPPPPPATGATTPAPQTAGGGDREKEQRRIAARAELDRAGADLEASEHDCASACRALASMERATVHICAIADEPDDRRRCDDAKKRVLAARDRVRSACGSCPGGPSVERDAPIPSMR